MASLAAGREVGVDEAERCAVEVERDRHSSLVPCNRQMCILYTSDLEYQLLVHMLTLRILSAA